MNNADPKELHGLALTPPELKQLAKLLPNDLETAHLLGPKRGLPFSQRERGVADALRFMQLALRIFKMSLVMVFENCGNALPTFVRNLKGVLERVGLLGRRAGGSSGKDEDVGRGGRKETRLGGTHGAHANVPLWDALDIKTQLHYPGWFETAGELSTQLPEAQLNPETLVVSRERADENMFRTNLFRVRPPSTVHGSGGGKNVRKNVRCCCTSYGSIDSRRPPRMGIVCCSTSSYPYGNSVLSSFYHKVLVEDDFRSPNTCPE